MKEKFTKERGQFSPRKQPIDVHLDFKLKSGYVFNIVKKE